MTAGDVAGDGKPEPGAAFVEIAGRIETIEWLEHRLVFFRRNPRPVVLDRDDEVSVLVTAADRDRLAMPAGIVDEIDQTALEALRAQLDDRLAGEGDAGLV